MSDTVNELLIQTKAHFLDNDVIVSNAEKKRVDNNHDTSDSNSDSSNEESSSVEGALHAMLKSRNIRTLSPKEIVTELDKFIIGQEEAKKAVAIAIYNRWRRIVVQPEYLRDDIKPKNILMKGPTGVGKTEIARRLAKIFTIPFIKVEATKFTERGYVGGDVDSIIRDLVDIAISLVRKEMHKKIIPKVCKEVEEQILGALIGKEVNDSTREAFRKKLHNKEIENWEIKINVKDNPKNVIPSFDITGSSGQVSLMNISDLINKLLNNNKNTKQKKVTIAKARELLTEEVSNNFLDENEIIKLAIHSASNDGIVFLDEVDKIAARTEIRGEVNREGVQRDLLPLLDGTVVSTKYGPVSTDHILFIAAGAFHLAKPSDLLPELQGRLPIRVELYPLSVENLICILKDTKSSLLQQYIALMLTERVNLRFTDEAITEIANFTANINRQSEDIGARRLHTIMEKLLEEISFNALEYRDKEFCITKECAQKALSALAKDFDLMRFIL